MTGYRTLSDKMWGAVPSVTGLPQPLLIPRGGIVLALHKDRDTDPLGLPRDLYARTLGREGRWLVWSSAMLEDAPSSPTILHV